MKSKKLNRYEDLLSDLNVIINCSSIDEGTFSNVADRLKLFGRNGVVIFLKEIMSSVTKTELIAQRSYLHGNGFYKIILEENDLFKLRLHIWEVENSAEENIHNHRWNFASTIITGTLKSEVWEYSADEKLGENLDEYLYVGKTKDAHPYHQFNGKVNVILTQNISHKSGEAYYLSPNIMHRVLHLGSEQVCTLVCQANNKSNESARTIIKRKGVPIEDHTVVNRYLNTSELADVLQNLLLNINS